MANPSAPRRHRASKELGLTVLEGPFGVRRVVGPSTTGYDSNMKRTIPWILIVASLVPTFLTGQSIYHCQITGDQGLVCGCGGGSESESDSADSKAEDIESACASCCSKPRARMTSTGERSPVFTRGCCSCCDVSRYTANLIRQAEPEPCRSFDLVGSLSPLLPFPNVAQELKLNRPVQCLGQAREGPHLFLLFSAFLC